MAREKTPMSTAGTWSNTRGFTLIELAVVVLLISLFSVLTLPMLTGIGEDRLAVSARRLAGTVKYLYNESALSGLEYRLVYNLDRGTFKAKRLERDGELTDLPRIGREQSLRGEVRFREIAVGGRGSFSSGEVTTEIHPVGWMEETVIHLSEEGREMTLRINPYTGSTEVFEGYRKL